MAGAAARIVAVAWAGLAAGGEAPATTSAPVSPATASDGAAAPPPPTAPTFVPPVATQSEMMAETDALLHALGTLRRIPLRGTLGRRVVARAQLRAQIEAVLASPASSTEREATGLILRRLGLLPEGRDHEKLLADGSLAAPSAMYDPLQRRLFVPNWQPLPEQRVALAHELAHVLADQRFGLQRTLTAGVDSTARGANSDRQRARQALIEGDAATLTLELFDPRGALMSGRELAAMVQRLREAAPEEPTPPAPRSAPPPAVASASAAPADPPVSPPIWRQLQSFPAVEGLAFVARVRAHRPWSAVDAIWANPPASTEQILHPDAYDRGEAPVLIQATPLKVLEESQRLVTTDTLGELLVRLWLGQTVPPAVAGRAAEGWGGDRVAVYLPTAADPADRTRSPPVDGDVDARPSQAVLAWLTVWDSVADAEDFARAAAQALAALASGDPAARESSRSGSGGRAIFHDQFGSLFALARRGDRVALLLGAPAQTASSLDTMLSDWRPIPSAAPAPTRPAKPPPRPRIPGRPR